MAVLALLGFGGLFLVNALTVDHTYGALSKARVAVSENARHCFFVPGSSFASRYGPSFGPPNTCDVAYVYRGRGFQTIVPVTWSKVFYVDPADPRIRANATVFNRTRTELRFDAVVAGLLFAGAVTVAIVHQVHYRRRLRRRRPGR